MYAIRSDHVVLLDLFKKTTQHTYGKDLDRSSKRLREHDAALAELERDASKLVKTQQDPAAKERPKKST